MNDQKAQIVDKLKNATNVLVTVSNDPSIDQLASCIALTLLVNKIQKQGTAVFSGKVPPVMEFLKPQDTLQPNPDSLRDFIISLDKAKADKLRYKVEDDVVKIFITPYHTSLSEKDLEFAPGDFNVDVIVALGVHHQQDLDSAITAHGRIFHDAVVLSINNTPDGDLGVANWQDLESSSLSELIAELAPELGENLLDEQIATALLTGIVAETSRFSNGKTHPRTMSISSALLAAGANQQLVAQQLQSITNGAAASALPGGAPAGLPETATPGSNDKPAELVINKDGTLQLPGQAEAPDNAPSGELPIVLPENNHPDDGQSTDKLPSDSLSPVPSDAVADNQQEKPAESTPESDQNATQSEGLSPGPVAPTAAADASNVDPPKPADPPADLFKTPAPAPADPSVARESPLTEPLGTPFDGLAPPPGVADQLNQHNGSDSNSEQGANQTLTELENSLNSQHSSSPGGQNSEQVSPSSFAPDAAQNQQKSESDNPEDDAEAARRAVHDALQSATGAGGDEPPEDLNAQEVDLGLEHNPAPLPPESPQAPSPESNPESPQASQQPGQAPQAPPAYAPMPSNPEAAAAMSPLIQPLPPNQPSYANAATTTEYVTPTAPSNEPAPLGMSPADQPFTMPMPPAGPPAPQPSQTPGAQFSPNPYGTVPATPPPPAAPPVPPPMMPGYGPQQNQ